MKRKVILFLFLLTFCLTTQTSLAKSPEIQLVVFDYDGTITDSNNRQEIRPENKAAFKDLVYSLRKQGIHVAIATYGSSPDKCLVSMFGKENPFHKKNVLSPSRIDPLWLDGTSAPNTWGYSKNTMIKKLRKRYKIRHKRSILFLDDKAENVEKAKKAGYRVYHVDPPCKGMATISPEIKEILGMENAHEVANPRQNPSTLSRFFNYIFSTTIFAIFELSGG